MKKNSQLWGGRFEQPTEDCLIDFNSSIDFDKELYAEDIEGSIAHSRMLKKIGILSNGEMTSIHKGLKKIRGKISDNKFKFSKENEDIHTNIEKALKKEIGVAAEKLHTARSRNDQVATDFRKYILNKNEQIIDSIVQLQASLLACAKKNDTVIMPGFTHLQHAQYILYSHYLMAYFFMFKRDVERHYDLVKRISILPLGSGAFAGVNYPVDREMIRKELNFSSISENSIDAVSSRDFLIEFLSAISITAMNLSRLSEEIILFSSPEFNFYTLPDELATGSSIMPNKKNPDIPELVRGKCGRIYGNLVTVLTMMKGIPLAYNKDMQEDKEAAFDSISTIISCLNISRRLFDKIRVNAEVMSEKSRIGCLEATDLADYLVKKGLSFRMSHEISGKIVKYCIQNKMMISSLSIEKLKSYNNKIETDIYKILTPKGSINNKKSYGSTSQKSVKNQINIAEKYLLAVKKQLG